MVRMTVSQRIQTFSASGCVLLLAACGTVPADPSPSPVSSVTETFTESSSTRQTTSTEPAPVSLCETDDVALTLGRGDGAAGSVYRPLLITNSDSKPCHIQGFPGVSYVAGEDGHQVGEAAHQAGEKGDVVTLVPGQTAAADIRFVNVQNYDPDVCRPTPVKGLRIYLPQETESNFVPMQGTGCANPDLPGDQLTVKSVRPN